MNARYYDPSLPQFISADNIVPDLYNPQTLNRYTYALNDPASLSDPSGNDTCEGDTENWVCLHVDPPPNPDGGTNPWSGPSASIEAPSSEGVSAPSLVVAPAGGAGTSCCAQTSSCCAEFSPEPEPATYGEFLAQKEQRRRAEGLVDIRLELQQDALLNITIKNLRGAENTVIALGIVDGASEMALARSALKATVAPAQLARGTAREMVEELKDSVGLVPPSGRVQAVRKWLNQISAANDGWQFSVGKLPGEAGTVFQPSRIDLPSIVVEPGGTIWYGELTFSAAARGFVRGKGWYLVR